MSVPRRPSLFLGSSAEGLPVAHALQELLHYDMEPTVWSQGLFQPSASLLQKLVHEARRYDMACFVFVPDDHLTMRDQQLRVVRDNVVFEYGLFVGAIGLDHCFIVTPLDSAALHLPSDLLGVVPLGFNASRSDANLVAALGPAANQLRRAWDALSSPFNAPVFSRGGRPANTTPELSPLDSLMAFWSSSPLAEDRALLRAGVDWNPASDDFPREAILRVFAFLESLSDGVISGRLPEEDAKTAFAEAVLSFWPHAAVSLAFPGSPSDYWQPTPKVAELFNRWRASSA